MLYEYRNSYGIILWRCQYYLFSFLWLELLDELSTVTGKNKETTKRDVRKRVRDVKNYTISDYSIPSNLIQEMRKYENG